MLEAITGLAIGALLARTVLWPLQTYLLTRSIRRTHQRLDDLSNDIKRSTP